MIHEFEFGLERLERSLCFPVRVTVISFLELAPDSRTFGLWEIADDILPLVPLAAVYPHIPFESFRDRAL